MRKKYLYYGLFLTIYTFLQPQVVLSNSNSNNSRKSGNKENFGSRKSVKFYAFTDPTNDKAGTEIQIGNITSLAVAGLIPGKQVKIMIHGVASNLDSPLEPCRMIMPEYLKKGFPNLICVDWSALAGSGKGEIPLLSLLMYVKILTVNVPRAGKRVAEFIAFLMKEGVVPHPKSVHMIGASLGAHVSGSAGSFVKQMTGKSVGRITGLDPAGPFLSYAKSHMKLENSCATFVEALHTDTTTAGSSESFGDADFFANGGRSQDQPICVLPSIVGLGWFSFACSHPLASFYFVRTIQGEVFTGCRCMRSKQELFPSTCAKPHNLSCIAPTPFGEYGSRKARGNYYLEVPFLKPLNTKK